jgi:hypothetical protein
LIRRGEKGRFDIDSENEMRFPGERVWISVKKRLSEDGRRMSEATDEPARGTSARRRSASPEVKDVLRKERVVFDR